MKNTKNKLHLSPSVYHKNMMKELIPSLSFNHKDINQWKIELKNKLTELIKIYPSKRGPLNVKSIWKKEHTLGTIEKIIFTSEPYADVPAYVCIPKKSKSPHRFFICLQGP